MPRPSRGPWLQGLLPPAVAGTEFGAPPRAAEATVSGAGAKGRPRAKSDVANIWGGRDSVLDCCNDGADPMNQTIASVASDERTWWRFDRDIEASWPDSGGSTVISQNEWNSASLSKFEKNSEQEHPVSSKDLKEKGIRSFQSQSRAGGGAQGSLGIGSLEIMKSRAW